MLLFLVMCVLSTACCFSIDLEDDGSYNLFNISNDINNISAVSDDEKSHRKYGLSLNDGCREYVKVFKCMTNCMALNFQIYRLNFRCDCTCHKKKSIYSTLPYFQWKTTGTTMKIPKTRSPYLWSIVGTLSPTPTVPTTTNASDVFTCPTLPALENTTLSGNETESGNGTDTTATGDEFSKGTTVGVEAGTGDAVPDAATGAADGATTEAAADGATADPEAPPVETTEPKIS